jgi:hypothetical protein
MLYPYPYSFLSPLFPPALLALLALLALILTNLLAIYVAD